MSEKHPLENQTETTETETLGRIRFHLKGCKSMKYNISNATAPAMSTVGKGTECIKLLLSQASKDMF